jgi:hypothetical protein
MITTDGESKFINSLLISFCNKLGIIENTNAPYSPQQNGLIEQFMQTISKKAQSLILHSGLPLGFPPGYWSLACDAAVYIQNRIFYQSRDSLFKCAYQLWYRHKPNLKYLHTFGCLAYIHIRKEA